MSAEKTINPQGGDIRVSGAGEPLRASVEVLGEPKLATAELIDMVTGATWEEALRRLGEPPSNPLPLWILLASRILRAVADGEGDPQRLKRLALEGLEYDGVGTWRRTL
jgi:hypothetical protein